MKEPIEELFKQSLKGHEMPYNPDAWKAMSARLDMVSPVATPTSYLKYYLGAAGIGVAAVATYFIFAAGNTPESTASPVAKETQTEQNEATSKANAKDKKHSNNPTTSNGEAQSGNATVIPAPTGTPTSPEKGLQTSNTKQTTKVDPDYSSGSLGVNTGVGSLSNHRQSGNLVNDPNNKVSGGEIGSPSLSRMNQKMIMPEINDLCLNEEITITNSNEQEIYVLDALNATVKIIPAKKSIVFKPSVVGTYSLGYKNDAKIQSSSTFTVNRIPDADFTVDLINKFENGIPSTHVQAIGGQGTYNWKAERQSAQGVEAEMHFYKKGEQTIELTVNNGQCASTVEKTIYIENDYNLMAVTGFTPTSNDPKTNTFMPFALTQRDVRFTLMILDGRDGGIVYKTSDASLPWDGTDIRSGRRSETPQVYVWKAVILNPETNEPSEYRGTITMN